MEQSKKKASPEGEAKCGQEKSLLEFFPNILVNLGLAAVVHLIHFGHKAIGVLFISLNGDCCGTFPGSLVQEELGRLAEEADLKHPAVYTGLVGSIGEDTGIVLFHEEVLDLELLAFFGEAGPFDEVTAFPNAGTFLFCALEYGEEVSFHVIGELADITPGVGVGFNITVAAQREGQGILLNAFLDILYGKPAARP